MKSLPLLEAFLILPLLSLHAQQPRVTISSGTLQGTYDSATGLRTFKGIPYAAPPIGDLRWRPPQPVQPWSGVHAATKFGPRAMQRYLYKDMFFRSAGMSEDCLYLNVWTPANSSSARFPVLVYFYGGGFITGDASEGRYDGAPLARQGIVVVTVNYRLNVFGFLALPSLAAESTHHAAGNYGLLDQQAALAWVRRNIAAFGGDPRRVTIGGESAGSISVSALMASPLSRGIIAGAIGESGSVIGPPLEIPLSKAESNGRKFVATLGFGPRPTLARLRALPASRLLAATASKAEFAKTHLTVDGWFFPQSPTAIYNSGAQARVPLLAGVNSQEAGADQVLKDKPPTVANYRAALDRLYPGHGAEVFRLYPASNSTQVLDSAQALASDRFISGRTWAWMDTATRTGGQPTWYYLYTRPRPAFAFTLRGIAAKMAAAKSKSLPPRGAVHSAEIEYALGDLGTNHTYAWTTDDQAISRQMQSYWLNFIKTGNPNSPSLPHWPRYATAQRLIIGVDTHAGSTSQLPPRYALLSKIFPSN